MPLLLVLPFLTFVLIVSGARSRRATSNLTAFGLLLTLADLVLVGWARVGVAYPYKTGFQWINLPVAFTGAVQFQGFGIDISFRVDHLALAAGAAVLLAALGAVMWHRFGGRQEPGPARLHAELALAVLGALGAIVSGDLAALSAWWGLCGVATYLLLAHRWGTEEAGRAWRMGLALPFAGDLSLLLAVAILYSRFGQLDIDKLAPLSVLHGTWGAGLRTVSVGAGLFALAAALRGGLFPFTAWQLGTLDAPPAIVAWVQGVWPLLAGVLLYRVLPVFNAAGPEAYRALAYECGLAVVAGSVPALVATDPRRAFTLAGSAFTALALLGLGQPGAAATGMAALVAAALARPAVVLAMASVVAAMRSLDVRDMGEVWQRMRGTAAGLLLGLLTLGAALVPKAAARASWRSSWFLVLGLVLLGAALARPYVAIVHGRLRRRRAFEPTRVREAAPPVVATVLGLAGGGLVLAGAGFAGPWLTFLAGGRPAPPATLVTWLAIALAGASAAGALTWARREAVLEWSARGQRVLGRGSELAGRGYDRLLRAPVLGIAGWVEEAAIGRAEAGLGRALGEGAEWAGRWAAAVPALGLAVVGLVVGAVLAVLLTPGVAR